jgi:hypothetical protein
MTERNLWVRIEALSAAVKDDSPPDEIESQLKSMPPETRQAIRDRMAAITGHLTRLDSMFELEDQDGWLPSAIDNLMMGKRIAEMTPDEYAAVARQAKKVIRDIGRLRRQIHDGIAKARVSASRTKQLLETMTEARKKDRPRRRA